MLGLKLIHVSKRDHRGPEVKQFATTVYTTFVMCLWRSALWLFGRLHCCLLFRKLMALFQLATQLTRKLTRVPFHQWLSIIIQIQWKFYFTVTIPCYRIASNFCTCHDCTAIIPCTKICNDLVPRIQIKVKSNLNYDGKILSKMCPWHVLMTRCQM